MLTPSTVHRSALLLYAALCAILGIHQTCAAPRLARADTALSVEQRVVAAARRHLQQQPRLAREDCSGLVESVLVESGVDQRGSVRQQWQQAREQRRTYRKELPLPGHLAFFDHTYDRNRNGKVDDPLSHIAVVTAVDDDGTIVLVHRPPRGIAELRMNLRYPRRHRVDGRVVNHVLRKPGYGTRRGKQYAAQLLRGFAAPLSAELRLEHRPARMAVGAHLTP